MKNILFVCTGNTCRSCMAEGFLRDLIKRSNKESEYQVTSAGLFVRIGDKASRYAIDVLKNEWNIDISDHVARQLKVKDLEDADIILTMTSLHKSSILERGAKYLDKVFTLREYVCGEKLDILDPYGGTYNEYRLCATSIKEQVDRFFDKFREEVKVMTNVEGKELVHCMDYKGTITKPLKNIEDELKNDLENIKTKIAIASDHAGLPLKDEIIKYFKEKDIEYKDYGTNTVQSVDYSDYGKKVAESVRDGECDRGIVICGTGIGISISANKIKGIRAALCTNSYMAKMSRLHNDSNILALGQRVTGVGVALDIVDTWLNTKFEGGRHQRRIDKIKSIENED